MTLQAREIEKTFASYGGIVGVRRDDSFGALYLADTFGINQNTAERHIDFGGNPFGIDSYYIDTEKKNLYLFQFKWTESYGAFKDPLRQLVHRGMDFLFGNLRDKESPSQFLVKLKSALTENRSVIDQVFIQLVFNGDPEDAEQSETLMALREELEGKKYLIDQFFGQRSIRVSIEFRSNNSQKIGGVAHQVKTHKYQIDFHRTITSETPHGEELQVGFVKLIDLYNMYTEMGARFFDRNVRSGLSSERPTNKSIQKSFRDIVFEETADPESFLFNHNGITLAAENFEIKKGAAYITEPRLLNGAQTVTSLARFMEDYDGTPELEENYHLLDRIRVLGKVVSSADHDFVSNVTICNNRQNPVEPWNLRANDSIQMDLQDKFRDELGLYYERQEGAFAHMTDEDLDDLGIESQKAIQIKRLAQAFLAAQGEIDKMSRVRYVFENETTYRNAFRESYLKVDARKILLAYKVQFRTNMVVRDVMEKWPQKYHFLGRAKNLVWALLVQGVFNENNIAELTQKYGSSLAIEVAFAEMLRELGTKRVRFLISEVVDTESYQEQMDVGNYNFLRTKATYQRCMQVAADRFGWKKRSF